MVYCPNKKCNNNNNNNREFSIERWENITKQTAGRKDWKEDIRCATGKTKPKHSLIRRGKKLPETKIITRKKNIQCQFIRL